LVVEVLSPSTKTRDRGVKLINYGKLGVPEYWIVNRVEKEIEVYKLDDSLLKLTEIYQAPPENYNPELDDNTYITQFETSLYGGELIIDVEEIFRDRRKKRIIKE
jgi:Uma2 family endonuclease